MTPEALVVGYEQFGVFEHQITMVHGDRKVKGNGETAAAARESCERQLGIYEEPEPARLAPPPVPPSRARPRAHQNWKTPRVQRAEGVA